ncbi:hypothetical protein INT43_009007 [Umbelopsis isabellina]|uniref:DUF4185 domain-containing protein n=1 Tax=Mortierella isabellina TaxID=91625 RepID=A0A8H7PVL4_MORIS|nr:hypothetical protein INT43_009007 [Umbelopsis isabellina]
MKLSLFLVASILIGSTLGSPLYKRATPVYPQPGQTKGNGVLPPKLSKATYKGTLQYKNTKCVRDLGFTGVVNGQIVWTFGDTVGLLSNGTPQLGISATDSAALGDMNNPLNVYDHALDSNGWPSEWIPFDSSESEGASRWAEGGTNVVEYATNKGLVWFLKNDRSSGQDSIVGAGVATVTAGSSGPKATRPDDTQWNNFEPMWGDIGVTYNSQDKNVYVFGHAPFTKSNLTGNVYLAKAPAAKALDVSSYQYWDEGNKAWTYTRFANGNLGTIDVSESQAIFKNREMGQSNAFWSNYYNTWMFVHGADVGYTDIMVKTADKLEGPWTTSFTIASTCPNNKCSDIRYAIAPHPEFDPTGKTLLVTWTDSNQIYAVTIEWE